MSAIVIGGGIAGCSTAYALAKRGIAVTLIDRHTQLAQEASGNPLAMLYPKLSIKPTLQNLITTHGFYFTLKLLQQLANHEHFFNACGQIQLAFNTTEKAKQDELCKKDYWYKNSDFLKFIDDVEASEIAGIALKTGGVFLPQAGWINPQLLCATLSNHGLINVQTSQHVLAIKPYQNDWRNGWTNSWKVQLKDDEIQAEHVIICNANEIKQFNFCQSAKVTPVRGQIDFFAPNAASAHLKTIICSDHYLSPAVDGMHSIGTTYAPNDTNSAISAIDTQSNLNALSTISPDMYAEINLKDVQSRVSWRSQTLDYRPLAGQLVDEAKMRANQPRYNVNPADLPWLHGLYVNAGHGSKGMITAPLCGELVASLITKTPLPLDEKLASSMNPSRFLLRELGLKQLAASLYT